MSHITEAQAREMKQQSLDARCQELKLTTDQVVLLKDLLGWNGEPFPPRSHRGVRVYNDMGWFEPARAQALDALLETLIEKLGDGDLALFKADPDGLSGRWVGLGLPIISRLIVIVQLGLEEKCLHNTQIEITVLAYKAPEQLMVYVTELLGFLLTQARPLARAVSFVSFCL